MVIYLFIYVFVHLKYFYWHSYMHNMELDEVGTPLGTWFPYPCGVSSSTSAASEAEETCSWQEIRTEWLLPHLSFHITLW
jgi:hypothetical protein